MDQQSSLNLVVFYSDLNPSSLHLRKMVNEVVRNRGCSASLAVSELRIEDNRRLSAEYGIAGTPALAVTRGDKIISRYFGSLNKKELESIVDQACRTAAGQDHKAGSVELKEKMDEG